MTQDKTKKIHLIYGCIVTLLLVALGIMLMVSAWQIYQSGAHPYTRASVGEKLQNMSVLIYVTAVFIVGGFVLNIVLPLDKKRPAALRDDLTIMNNLSAKAGQPSGADKAAIDKEQNLRQLLPAITCLVYIGLLIWPALYMFNSTHFPGVDPTAEIISAALIVLPFALGGLVLCHVCGLIMTASIHRQTAIYKQMIAEKKGTPVEATFGKAKQLPITAIRCVVLAVAIIFIVAGIFNGSAEDVLTKAVKICTECIGLG